MTAEDDFLRGTLAGVKLCKEFGYNPTYWVRMVQEYGAVDAARRLLRGSRASDGFTRLWEEGRLDLSVEFFVLLPEYAQLFTEGERVEARRRLELYEFDIDAHVSGRGEAMSLAETDEERSDEGATTEVVEQSPEEPVVAPVVPPGGENTVWPSLEDLRAARELFGTNEPRDIMYRAATDLVAMALRGDASVTVAEAIGVLLQTWNRQFYQYRRVGPEHYDEIESLLSKHSAWLAQAQGQNGRFHRTRRRGRHWERVRGL